MVSRGTPNAGNAKWESPAKAWIIEEVNQAQLSIPSPLSYVSSRTFQDELSFWLKKVSKLQENLLSLERRRLIANIVALTSKQKTKWSKVEQTRYFGN